MSALRLIRRIPLECLLISVCVAAVLVFYGTQNIRGHLAWKNYIKAVQARGDALDVPQFTGEIQRRMQASEAMARELAMASGTFGNLNQHVRSFGPRIETGTLPDFVKCAHHLSAVKSGQGTEPVRPGTNDTNILDQAAAAKVICDILGEHNSYIERVRAACRPPELIYPFGYDRAGKGGSPRIFEAINVCSHLRLQTAAQLATRQATSALRDVELMLNLSESLRRDRGLLPVIGSLACRQMALSPLWSGFAARRFAEADLQQLQKLLAYADPLAEFRGATQCERNQILEMLEDVRRTDNYASTIGTRSTLLRLLPDGWMQLEKSSYGRVIDNYLAVAFSGSSSRIHLIASERALSASRARLEQAPGLLAMMNGTILTTMFMPNLWDTANKAASARVLTDQLVLACGVERFYLKSQRYPDNLRQLIPEFLFELPKDPLSGGLYMYALRGGRYRIWSWGPNEKDDGGSPVDDWLWHYPDH